MKPLVLFSILLLSFLSSFAQDLKAGWYVVSESSSAPMLSYEQTMINLESPALIGWEHIRETNQFHEKSCYALISYLDSFAAAILWKFTQVHPKAQIALVVENKIVRIQSLADTQFARISETEDPRVYGQILTLPCNFKKGAELDRIRLKLEQSEKPSSR